MSVPLVCNVEILLISCYTLVSNYAIIDINNSDSILPNTHLSLEFISQFGSAAVCNINLKKNNHPLTSKQIAIGKMIEYDRQNKTFIIGDLFSSISTQTGIAGAVFNIAQLSLGATTSTLSDKHIYPYYSRMVPPNNSQVNALISAIEYYGSIQAGWDNVAVICTAVEYGIDISENFIAKSKNQFEIADYRQILSTQTNFDTEIRELVNSKARVFAAFILNIQWEQFLFSANDAGLIGDNYVWFTGSIISSQRPSNDTVDRLWAGVITAIPFHPAVTPQLDQFVDRWSDEALPELTEATKLGYDAIVAAALAIDAIDKKGMLEQPRISGEEWSNTLRSVEFDGLSGPVKFNEFGDLVIDFELVFYNYANKTWDPAAIYNEADNSLEFIKNVIFFSGSEQVPDLDIREPRAYWSCHSSKMKIDETGKTVIIHTPGSKDVDDIDSDYHCDRFIDCNNLSDETEDCSTNYTALFITFGIITGIMVFVCVILLIFVVAFGICLHYRRLRRVSPGILVLLLISMIMGFCSIYAWFGKPHPVACAFQPWLLALSSIGMISALCVKTFRIWRIFRKQFVKVVISDIQLVILWIFLMIPVVCILILWMIISTPTAKLQDFDGTEHYVCATGGFTGHPGGYIFFALVVAYGAFVLLCGIFLTIVTRNTPSMYNESKLLAISIYNIGFLSAVIIPVFLVVQPFNPFIAWILRTVAILYAFTGPLLLQFIEPVLGIIIIDRCKNNTTFIPIGITTSPN